MRSDDETNALGPGRCCRADVRSHRRTSEPPHLDLQRPTSPCHAIRAALCCPSSASVAPARGGLWGDKPERKDIKRAMRKLVPILAITAFFRGLPSVARTMDGGIPRSMRTTPPRPALAGAAVLIAILAAVLFTGPPAWAQGENEDLIQVTVSFTFPSNGYVAEGGTYSIGVDLSADPKREVVIPITFTERGGASAADYSGVPSSVTFSSEECYDEDDENCYETYKSFEFTAAEDSEDDDGESVQLVFGSPLPAGVSLGPIQPKTLWITDGGAVHTGLAQAGVGVAAHLRDDSGSISNMAWQWQRSATEDGTYSDIPAMEGGTSNPYTPSANDLGMWLKAKVTYQLTYEDDSVTGHTAHGTIQQPVLSQPAVSNGGFSHHDDGVFVYIVVDHEHPYAQGFTTGPDVRGYLLVEARLVLYTNDGIPDATWAVHADAAGKPADAPLSAPLPIQGISDLDNTFEALTHPSGVHLQPDTPYWIVISETLSPEERRRWRLGSMDGPYAGTFGGSRPG